MIDCDLLVILDRSGSMQDRKADHEGGLRSFVEDQRTLAGDVRLTLVQFDEHDPCEIIYDRVALSQVSDITLIPRGGTPLLDAIGKAVAHLRAQQVHAPSAQTVILIITDGWENASREWTKPRVKALLEEVTAAGGQTLFLGAGIDAFAEAGELGVKVGTTMSVNNTSGSVGMAYSITSDKMLRARSLHTSGASAMSVAAAFDYTAEERASVTAANTVTVTTPEAK